jgi:hypothetical protein
MTSYLNKPNIISSAGKFKSEYYRYINLVNFICNGTKYDILKMMAHILLVYNYKHKISKTKKNAR